jgi:lipoprotein-anchoring transpeptidase ErfK/SrfK
MKRVGAITKSRQALGLLAVLSLQTVLLAQNSARIQPNSHPHRVVLVSLPDRQLAVLEDGVVLRTFPVSIGAANSPSPVGDFRIITQVANPAYYHQGAVIPAGPNNPLGSRWIGISLKGYGIHGTNAPRSIGKAASHGCIRLNNHDVVELYPLLSVGDTVQIRAARDPQTARIFGLDDHAIVAQAHVNALENQSRTR